jgi:hypothetical protein
LCKQVKENYAINTSTFRTKVNEASGTIKNYLAIVAAFFIAFEKNKMPKQFSLLAKKSASMAA